MKTSPFLLAALLSGVALFSSVATVSSPSTAESARAQRVSELLRQREKLLDAGKMPELKACDAEIKRHPAPQDADPRAMSSLLIGKWRSTRHDFLFRADGSWTMLPAEAGTLHGRWHIQGNQLEETSGYQKPDATSRYTIILLTKMDYVFTDGETVFCEKRL